VDTVDEWKDDEDEFGGFQGRWSISQNDEPSKAREKETVANSGCTSFSHSSMFAVDTNTLLPGALREIHIRSNFQVWYYERIKCHVHLKKLNMNKTNISSQVQQIKYFATIELLLYNIIFIFHTSPVTKYHSHWPIFQVSII